MNAAEIKNRVLTTLKSVFNMETLTAYLKDTIKLPYAKIYLLVVAPVALVLMIIITFPFDMLIRRSLKKLEPMVVKSFIVNEIEFSFFNDIYLKDILILTNGGSEITAKEADIDASLNPFRLFVSKNLKFALAIDKFRFSSESVKIDFNATSNIQLSFGKYAEFPRQGMFKLMFENAHIEINKLPLPEAAGGAMITLNKFRIKSMIISGMMTGRMLTIQDARILGQDLRGSITGTITIDPLFMNSRLDLRISIDAESPVIADYKILLGQFIKENNVVLPIRGTLANPQLSFDGGSADSMPAPSPGPSTLPRAQTPPRSTAPLPRPQGQPPRQTPMTVPSVPAQESPESREN